MLNASPIIALHVWCFNSKL